MTSILNNIRFFSETIIESLGYWGVGFLMAIENIFPPIPSELVLPMAGFLVSEGQMHILPLLLASTIGTLLGTSFLYYLGLRFGDQGLRKLLRGYARYIFSEASYDRALQAFNTHDKAILFWSRLLPGLRSIISLPAGVAQVPLGRFLFYTTLGTLLWNSLLLSAGVWLGANWTQVIGFIDQFKTVLLIAGLSIFCFWLFMKLKGLGKTLK